MNNIIFFIEDHKEAIGIASGLIWELIVRIRPTCADWSLINGIKRLFDIIPNKSKMGGEHK